MNQTSCFATSTHALHCALELSKKSWLLAIQFPDREQPSVYSIKGGDTEKLPGDFESRQWPSACHYD